MQLTKLHHTTIHHTAPHCTTPHHTTSWCQFYHHQCTIHQCETHHTTLHPAISPSPMLCPHHNTLHQTTTHPHYAAPGPAWCALQTPPNAQPMGTLKAKEIKVRFVVACSDVFVARPRLKQAAFIFHLISQSVLTAWRLPALCNKQTHKMYKNIAMYFLHELIPTLIIGNNILVCYFKWREVHSRIEGELRLELGFGKVSILRFP